MHPSRPRRAPAAACTLALCATSAVHAAPTLFPGTGHSYELILVADPYAGANNAWQTAQNAAAASSFLGTPGHLATVSSSEENAFLVSLIPALPPEFAGAWLGGKSPEGWLVGSDAGPFAYTNFGGSEPNNNGYTYMNIGPLFANIGTGQWADDSGVQGAPEAGIDPVIGYFVEYDTPAPTCPGDINDDGFTNSADFNILAGHFGQNVTPNTNGDLTGDGLVNSADFNVLAGDFGCAS